MSITLPSTFIDSLTTTNCLNVYSGMIQNVIAMTDTAPNNPSWGDRYFSLAPNTGWSNPNVFETFFDEWQESTPGPGQIFNVLTGGNAGLKVVNSAGNIDAFTNGTISATAPISGDGSGSSPITLSATSSAPGIYQYANGAWQTGYTKYTNVVFVDSAGVDVDGQLNNPFRPYLTIGAAKTALGSPASPSLIYVRVGSYSVASTLLDNNVNYYFEPGTIVTGTLNTTPLSWPGPAALTSISVLGQASFIASGAQVLSITSSSNILIQAKSISSDNIAVTLSGSNSGFTLNCPSITSTTAEAITLTGAGSGTVVFQSQNINGGIAISCSNTNIMVVGSVYSTAVPALSITGGTNYASIYASEIQGVFAAINQSDSTTYIRANYIASSGGGAINISGGTSDIDCNTTASLNTSYGLTMSGGTLRIRTNTLQGITSSGASTLYADIGSLTNVNAGNAINTAANSSGTLYIKACNITTSTLCSIIGASFNFTTYISANQMIGTNGILSYSNAGTHYVKVDYFNAGVSGYGIALANNVIFDFACKSFYAGDGVNYTSSGEAHFNIDKMILFGNNAAYTLNGSGYCFIKGNEVSCASSYCIAATANTNGVIDVSIYKATNAGGACITFDKMGGGRLYIHDSYFYTTNVYCALVTTGASVSTTTTVMQNTILANPTGSPSPAAIFNTGGAIPTIRIYGNLTTTYSSPSVSFIIGTNTVNANVS